MRAAIFTDNDFDKVNGVTTTLKAVLKHVPPGVTARIFTAANSAEVSPNYFAVSSVGIGLPFYREMRIYWPRMRALRQALRGFQPDVIHITTPGPLGLAGRVLASELNVPVTGSYHTHLGDYTRILSGSAALGRWLERYMQWLYAPCRPLLVPSHATLDAAVQTGYARERLGVWSRGIDSDRFSPDRRSHALRERWRVDDRRPVVLYVGRLSREKGLDLVPVVQRALHRRAAAHRLVFAGDGPMRAELEERCPDAVFLGTVPHDRVGEVMASSDVFLFPSTTDTFGNVILEAEASGLPSVVSDRGGPCERVVHGETGFVCRTDEADDFADRVAVLLKNKDRRAQFGAAARERALANDWPTMLAPLFGAWSRAASGPADLGRESSTDTVTSHAS